MNNAIMATVMIAMMFAIAASTPYIFGPSPAVIFNAVDDNNEDKNLLTHDVAARRGR